MVANTAELHPSLGERLHRRWRQLASGLCFSIFGLFGLLYSVVLIPLAAVWMRDPQARRRRARGLIRAAMHGFWRTMQALGLFRCTVVGAEHLTAPGILIVANHPTLIDAVLLLGLIDNGACVAKRALARNRITGPALKAAGYIVSDDGPAMVEAAARELAQGGRLLVFPESTRTPLGGPLIFQRGAANIAARTGCRVVTVTIRVSEPLLYKGAPWYRMPMRVPRFDVRVQPGFETTAVVARSGNPALAARDLNARLQAIFETELGAGGPA
jgi:1-acyl-sn-glycerol-3-phosphate acyltransferase